MKHYLSLLCFALTSFFLTDKAVANLLLKQNPTPLEPVSYASSGESYQLAKVTWLPDYLGHNKSYGVNRVNDGGKDKNDRGCSTYGFLDNCAEHQIAKGAKYIAGLTCYEECICDTSYYKYTTSNCRSPKKLSEGCSDLKKATAMGEATIKSDTVANLSKTRQFASMTGTIAGTSASIIKYARCTCPTEYNLSSCPTNANCEVCDSKHKFISCKDGYTMTSSGTCEAMSCSSYGGYDVCPAGYGVTENFSTPAGKHCVKCSKCTAGTYSKGTGACVACACGTYSSQAGASSCTACASGSYQTATGQTSCKTVAHVEGWTISADKCTITKKSCAAGYSAGVTTCSKGAYSSSGYSGDEVCGKCTLSDECPTGYSKTACTSSQKQMASSQTEAGSMCYQCKNDTCASGYSKTACTSSQTQIGTTSTEAGSTCYKCEAKDDNCPTGYGKTACTSSQTQTGTTTTEAGSVCYKCENITCPIGYSNAPCVSSLQKETNRKQLSSGLWCYECKECEEYAKYLGKTVVYDDTENHEDLLYKALVAGKEEIYIIQETPISAEAAKACYNVGHTCSTEIHFKNIEDLDPICSGLEGALVGEFYLKKGSLYFETRTNLSRIEIKEGSLLEFSADDSSIENFYIWGGQTTIRVNNGELTMSSGSNNGTIVFECKAGSTISNTLSLYTQWCKNGNGRYICSSDCFPGL